jgi:hypothetical protein
MLGVFQSQPYQGEIPCSLDKRAQTLSSDFQAPGVVALISQERREEHGSTTGAETFTPQQENGFQLLNLTDT